MGQTDAWILEAYPSLIRIVQKRLGTDPVQSLDLVHDAILVIYDSMDRYDAEKGEFKAWAAGIMRNLILRHFEGRGRREKLTTEEELDSHENPGDTPAAVEAIVKEVTGVINKTLDTVPPLYRDVLRMRYRESRPLKDISKRLKVPLGTVKARLSRASDILKDALNFQQTTVRTYLDGR